MVQRCSGLYETAAAYVTQQPAFLNAALLLTTDAPPRDLLHSLKEAKSGNRRSGLVERAAGRQLEGGQRWGPRPLDLDIILYGAASFQDERLQ
ncbi:HPPK domain-containing protein, partial [Haematococcus lacustris]